MAPLDAVLWPPKLADALQGVFKPLTPMNWKIEITESHSGELGEAIHHEDHVIESEEYHYDRGQVLQVFVHSAANPQWHIFTDLDSGHRFKIPPDKYRQVD